MNAVDLWLLVFIANAAPLAAPPLGRGLGGPIDLGLRLPDGDRLFGAHKRWQGLALSLAGTGAAAWALGLPVGMGLAVSLWAMAGDLAASLIKRRFAIAPGISVPVLDQLPESVLPLIIIGRPQLSWSTIALLSLAFMAADLLLRLAYSRIRRS